MASPVTPNNLKDKLPSVDGANTVCVRLKKVLIDFPKLVYEFIAYIFDEEGHLTEGFKTDVCNIKCDTVVTKVDPDPNKPNKGGGKLQQTTVRTIAGSSNVPGIRLVWDAVSGATGYDIYRYKTASAGETVADADILTKATRIRRDAPAKGGGIYGGQPEALATTADGYMHLRTADQTILYVDVNGGPLYVGDGVTEETANELDDQTEYLYWVAPRDISGATVVTGPLSNPVRGFSKYITDFASGDSDDELLFSGYEQDVPNSKSVMRVVLRGGGGGGAGGGDHVVQSYNAPFVKTIADNASVITFTTYVNHGFSRKETIRLTESEDDNGGTSWDGDYTISKFTSSTSFEVGANPADGNYVPHSDAPVQNGFTPSGESTEAYGKVHRISDEVPLHIAGAGGGSGGFLVAVFDIGLSGYTAPTKVRVRTIDNSNATVDYNSRGQNTTTLTGYFQSQVIPWNRGGEGRSTAAVGPKTGEPSANDSNATNDGATNGYHTLFEIYDGSAWFEVARVANGKGGGYDTVSSDHTGRGGAGAAKLAAAATTNRANKCTLRTSVKFGSSTGTGYKEYAGFLGSDSSAGVKGTNRNGGAGVGGHAWDSASPSHPSTDMSNANAWKRQSNGFDVSAPGSGGSGSMGATDETNAYFAHGGHALAGCAWVTYSATAHDDVDEANG